MSSMRAPKMKKVKTETFGTGKHKMKSQKNICFKSSELPELKDWKVGEKYKIILEVTQESTRLDDKEIVATFKVNSVGNYTK